ncbi:MAG TPA: NUDIX domain-containing protein [Gemmatimonadaceae bacterium]|jgi:8-oxo-dGTP pyrophosphatase MutT (NUDIX family)
MRLQTVRQVSAGGVAYRQTVGGAIEVALIRVGPERWQLPKGLVEEGESLESAAVREVREEAGITGRIIAPLQRIEYWYVGLDAKEQRVRFHKFLHLFLLEYEEGDVAQHDNEVDDARWVRLDEAEATLAFASERKAMREARALIHARPAPPA